MMNIGIIVRVAFGFFLGGEAWGACENSLVNDEEGASWICDNGKKIRCDAKKAEQDNLAVRGHHCILEGNRYLWKPVMESQDVSGNSLHEQYINHLSPGQSLEPAIDNTPNSFHDLLTSKDEAIQKIRDDALLPITFPKMGFYQTYNPTEKKLLDSQKLKEALTKMSQLFDCVFTLDDPGEDKLETLETNISGTDSWGESGKNAYNKATKGVAQAANSIGDRYHSIAQGQANKEARRKVVSSWKKCQGQETIAFVKESGGKDDWTVDNPRSIKDFVFSLRFNIDKDNQENDLSGKNIVKSMLPGFTKETRYGWYSLEPKGHVGQASVALNLDCNSSVGTSNTCSNPDNFFRKLSSCNMRQLYHSLCLRWAAQSDWVKKLGKIPENIVYTFVLYELLQRYDHLVHRNNKVRGLERLFKHSSEYRAIQEAEKELQKLEPNLSDKEIGLGIYNALRVMVQ